MLQQMRWGWIISGVIALLIIGSVYYVLANRTDNQSNTTVITSPGPSTTTTSNTPTVGTDTLSDYQGKVLAGTIAPFLEFNQGDYEKTVASGKLVVLYFYANWCPVCKEEEPRIQKIFSGFMTEKKSFDQVVGFRVNYNDNETDKDEENLAREFGVAYQHTKVFVKNGQRVLKSPETWTNERYIEEINKALGQ